MLITSLSRILKQGGGREKKKNKLFLSLFKPGGKKTRGQTFFAFIGKFVNGRYGRKRIRIDFFPI